MQECGYVVVTVRQRYCNPASTPAEVEIPSSAAWTIRKMTRAAAAANAIRYRAKCVCMCAASFEKDPFRGIPFVPRMVRIGYVACDRPLGHTRSPKGQQSSPWPGSMIGRPSFAARSLTAGGRSAVPELQLRRTGLSLGAAGPREEVGLLDARAGGRRDGA